MNFVLVILHWALDGRERVDSGLLPKLAVVLASVLVVAYYVGSAAPGPTARLVAHSPAY